MNNEIRKIIILFFILAQIATASDIIGDINNDGILSGEEQYLLNNATTNQPQPTPQIEAINPNQTTLPLPETNPVNIQRDENGHIKRSQTAKNNFKKNNPCPSNNKHAGSCPGYVIDHIKPLACGGADDPSNMQWQTVQAAKIKDKTERDNCQATTTHNPSTYQPKPTPNTDYHIDNRQIHTGPRGGRYTISPSGKKQYIKHH